MFVVDANVLACVANEDSPFHRRCADLLAKWQRRPGAWFLTWGHDLAKALVDDILTSSPPMA